MITNDTTPIWAAISAPNDVREEEMAAALAKVGWAIDEIDSELTVALAKAGNGDSGRTTLFALVTVDAATSTELEEDGWIERRLDHGVRVKAEMP